MTGETPSPATTPTDDAAGAPEAPDTPVATGPGPEHDDIAALPYEQARDELVTIVAQLEAGRADLEESMRLWERGEALAAHCSRWLDGAQERLEARMETRQGD